MPKRARGGFTKSVRDHWGLILVEGIILTLLGLLAVAGPPIARLTMTVFIGWLLLVSGVVGLASTSWARHAPGFWWSLLSAVLATLVGIILTLWPTGGAVCLIYVLVSFFVIEGIATIMFAVEHRRHLSGRWKWMIASGVVDLILAAVVVAGLPGTAASAIGLLVGINMVFGGCALIAMALHARAQA
jgi:uncharacterized membrane protein HdeD (DUF308 family)